MEKTIDKSSYQKQLEAKKFKPSKKKSKLDFKRICAKTGAPKWTTFNAQSFGRTQADSAVLRWCFMKDSWGQAQHTWLAQLAPAGVLMRWVGDGVAKAGP